ncbi:MAG TPA: HIT domain-containing protein [Chloroflexia bacterium]|nr:HIT domain-containing protein [Chloroflexia bacterium]
MDTLWSPWRMAYINGDPGEAAATQAAGAATEPARAPGCIFCTKPAEPPAQDRKNLLLWRGRSCFVILNLYPYNSAHLMVVPYRHLRDFTALTPEESAELLAVAQQMVRALTTEYHPEGFNLGMNLGEVAGAGIADHLHLHIVPRWAGDTNFMPVVGQTKVLPEALEQTYDRLRRALERLA